MVKLSYYGYIPAKFPAELDVPDGTNLKQYLIPMIEAQNISLEEFFFDNLIVVNGLRMEDDTVVKDGDIVDIFPPAIMG